MLHVVIVFLASIIAAGAARMRNTPRGTMRLDIWNYDGCYLEQLYEYSWRNAIGPYVCITTRVVLLVESITCAVLRGAQ
jgi:hypothetical protein